MTSRHRRRLGEQTVPRLSPTDCSGFIQVLLFLPLLIAVVLLILGISNIMGGATDTGFILAGFGLLFLIPNTARISYRGVTIEGGVGFILILVGVFLL